MKFIYIFLSWLSVFVYTDGAIILWIKSHKNLLLTILVMGAVSTFMILVEAGVVDGFIFGGKKILKAWRRKKNNGNGDYGEKVGFARILYLRVFLTKWTADFLLRADKFKYFIIFLFTVVPLVPYIKAGCIVYCRVKRVKFGIETIILANLLKVFLFSFWLFYYFKS